MNKPKIKTKEVRRSKYYHCYLTIPEKKILFKKFISEGYSYEEADKKVKKIVEHLANLVAKLKEKKKSEGEIQRKFQEEFAKLRESY